MGLGTSIKEFVVGVSIAFDKTGFNQAESAVGRFGRDLRSFGITVAATAGTLFGLAEASGSHSRELKNTASQLGITTDDLQKLGYAAKVAANLTQEELVGSLEGLSHTLFESRNRSSDASRTLLALGVSAETLNNPLTNSQTLLGEIADKFAALPDGIQKTAYANEVFGASGAKMIPMLNKGRAGLKELGDEAQRSGIILGKGFIDQGAAYEKRMTKVWFVLKNIAYTIGGQLMKYLLPLVDTFQKWIGQNQKLVSMNIGVGLKVLGEVLKMVGTGGLAFLDVIKQIAPKVGGMSSLIKILAIAFMAYRASVSPITVGLLALGAVLQDVWTYFQGGDSYTGDFIASCKKLFATVSGFYIFQKIGGWIKYAYDMVSPFIKAIDDFLGVSQKMETAFDWMKDAGGKVGKGLWDGMKGAADWAVHGPDQIAPQTAFAGAQSLSGGSQGLKNLSAQITVMVAPGTSVSDATNIVSSGVENGVSKALRPTRDQRSGGRKF